MKFLPESKIDIVNQLAAAICTETCATERCGLCQLHQLKSGIDLVLGEQRPVEEAIEAMVSNYRDNISHANDKYDRYVMNGKVR